MLRRLTLACLLAAVSLVALVRSEPARAAPQVEVRHDSATVSFRTAVPARLQVEYGQPGRLGLFTRHEPTPRLEHRAVLHGLDPDRVYGVRVRLPDGSLSTTRFRTTARPVEPRHSHEQGRRIVLDGEPFLPILSWAQCPETMAESRTLGFDVFMGPPCGAPAAQLDAANGVNALAAVPFDPSLRDHPALFGYHYADEPDAAGTTPATVTRQGRTIETSDPRHVRILTVSRGFYSPPFVVYPWLAGDHLGHYRRYASAADLSGFVLYPRWILCDGALLPLVADMQRLYTRTIAPGRPTFQWIEAAAGNNPSCSGSRAVPVTGAEVAAESWMAIVHGATAIGYFTLTHAEGNAEPRRLDVTPGVAASLRRTTAELKALAPALLADPASLAVTRLAGRLDATARTHNGAFYVLAVNPGRTPARARVAVPDGADRAGRFWRTGRSLRLDGSGALELSLPPLGSAVIVFPPEF
jgi:hypothetical protein